MIFLTIGKRISADDVPSGIKRTIVEYFLAKQEIIIEKTVVGGSPGLSMAPRILPPL